jgi:hypothetical protein
VGRECRGFFFLYIKVSLVGCGWECGERMSLFICFLKSLHVRVCCWPLTALAPRASRTPPSPAVPDKGYAPSLILLSTRTLGETYIKLEESGCLDIVN